MKQYICPRWPNYAIGRNIKFVEGWFQTEDPELISSIESNDWYRVFIWPADGVDYGQESDGGIPPIQRVEAGESAGAGEEQSPGSDEQGREESPVLQELEELVRGSGITGGKGRKNKPSAG